MTNRDQPDSGWRQWALNNALPRNEASGMTTPTATGFTPGPANPQPLNFGGVNVAPDFDVIELLPRDAADKFRALRQRAADAHAVVPEFETIRQASMTKIEAENAVRRLVDHPHQRGFGLGPEDRQVIAATKTLEKATADFKRLTELQEVRTAAWQSVSAATAACENWLRDGRPHGTVLEQFDGPEPKLLKNETLLDAIDRLRRRGRELRAALHTIKSSCYPSSYCKQRAREQVEQLAQRGAVSVSNLVEHDGDIEFPAMQITSTIHNVGGGAVAFHEAVDVAGLMAFLHKSELIAALDREIDAEADDGAALTHEAREQRKAETMGDLLSVERDEAALCWRAMDERLPCEFRADISPLAILQIRLVTTPRGNAPPTSVDHAYDIVPPGMRR